MYDEAIFGAEAPKYYAKNMAVIPLHHWTATDKDGNEKGKRPFFFNWSKWQKQMPTEEEQAQWVQMYPSNNIGLVLGAVSNMDMLDIDTDNQKLIDAIMSLVPTSPWVRVGQKGMMLAFRHNPNIKKKIQIDEKTDHAVSGGVRVVEYLTGGQQIVLPPSIHPKTRKPYVANVSLYDLDPAFLPMVPDNLEELLRSKLSTLIELRTPETKSYGIGKKISFGSRDSSMTQLAGSLSLDILKGRASVLTAFNYMQSWVEESIEQIEGDKIDYNKGINQIVNFLINDVSKGKVLPEGWDEGLSEQDKKEYHLDFNEDNQAWSYDQMISYLKKIYESPDTTQVQRSAATEAILKKITVSPNIGLLEREKILNFMSKSSGDKLTAAKYNNRLKELEKGEISGANHTEIAEEALVEYRRKNGQLNVHGTEFWRWGGSHWLKVQTEPTINSFIALHYGHLDAAKKKSDHNGICRIMASITDHGLSKVETPGVNFANGFLTRDLKLVAHDPAYGMTYTLPFSYDPDASARCPRFLQFLEQSWGHNDDYHERVEVLKEVIAATMFGVATSYQKAILLHGAPGTGKSQLLEIISALVPEDAKSVMPPKYWAEKHALIDLVGKILNICGELPDDGYIDGESFKQMVDGSEITDRGLYQSFTKFRCTAALWFAANKYPKSRDTTGGFSRRWLVLHFDRVIEEKDIVLDLGKSIVKEEGAAIAAWALASYPELHRRGNYQLPTSHFKHHNEMTMSNSNVRQFIDEKVVMEEGASTSLETLHRAYWIYVNITLGSVKPFARPRFLEELTQILEERSKNGLRARAEKNDKHETVLINVRLVG